MLCCCTIHATWPKSRKRKKRTINEQKTWQCCNIAARKQLKTLSYDQNSPHTGFCWVHLSTRRTGFLGTMFLNEGLSSVWFTAVNLRSTINVHKSAIRLWQAVFKLGVDHKFAHPNLVNLVFIGSTIVITLGRPLWSNSPSPNRT